MIREAVRAFAAKEIVPVVKEHDLAQTFDRSLLPKMAAQGLLGVCLPVRYGGAGMDYISMGLACEELEWADTSALAGPHSGRAVEMGHPGSANMILLGAVCALSKLADLETLKLSLPVSNREINEMALARGFAFGEGKG